MRWLTACLIGLPLLGSGASAQPPRPHEHDHAEVATEDAGSRPLWRRIRLDSARADRSGGVSTTPDNRILVELAPEDATAANLFDLNERTLILTPLSGRVKTGQYGQLVILAGLGCPPRSRQTSKAAIRARFSPSPGKTTSAGRSPTETRSAFRASRSTSRVRTAAPVVVVSATMTVRGLANRFGVPR